ncbi:MAG TPA: gamma-glutamyl-gamma-aminobutyrate hydrolase family protein [Thermoleophilaceae bacterium]|jgi:putative glutamine amidotransferase|nr:gamma-glutamyl-gamma-aminobutyrate hydrolase family protein [Thermoleophilaceae bacterium]
MTNSTPVIGISAALEQARWGSWDSLVLLSPRNYSLAVQRADALALILSPDEAVTDDPDRLLDRLDALLLSGGSDLNPVSYGAEPDPETRPALEERDLFEIALARAAVARDMPVLGVCRGMQILNVALGGTLDQHVANLAVHRNTPGVFHEHEVALEPDSLAARAAGGERLRVKSHHHQGVANLGDGLLVSGRAVEDDLVEAIEAPDRTFALGLLWHPEEDDRMDGVHPIGELARAARSAAPA